MPVQDDPNYSLGIGPRGLGGPGLEQGPTTGAGLFPPTPVPGTSTQADQDTTPFPTDLIGDIPPPPVPAPPPIVGSGVAGIPGTEAGTFSRPGTRGAMPFRTAAARFGPGMPAAGASSMLPMGMEGLGMTPEDAAEILRRMAAGGGMMGGGR